MLVEGVRIEHPRYDLMLNEETLLGLAFDLAILLTGSTHIKVHLLLSQ